MKLDRRDFLRLSAATGAAFSVSSLLQASCYAAPEAVAPRPIGANDKLNVLCVGVIGTIGGADRAQVARHPRVNIAGLCDVDSGTLARAGNDHKDAFRVRDYREAFDKHGDKFDAVIVSTPDHTHCAIDTLAMSKGKHVYGQKPLVQQLEEVAILRSQVEANPGLSTQMGNQRMENAGRRAFVHIARSGALGKAKEAWVVTGSGVKGGGQYFHNSRSLDPVTAPPANLDWDLWQGGVQPLMDFRPNCAPVKWRTWWNYGTGGLGDWGCHLLDVLFYAFDGLHTPVSTIATVQDPTTEYFHAYGCKSVVTYKVAGDKFASDTFRIHYADEKQMPDKAPLGLPPEANLFGNPTILVCEGGVMVLDAGGALEVWRDGKKEDWGKMEGMPKFAGFNHWHEWVNTAVNGKRGENHWSPFGVGLRITEATLLAVKATKFPGTELKWDCKKMRITNHAEADKTVVRRDYRKGFEPVRA